MFIIIKKDSFFGLEIVLDYLGKPKIFTCESEAMDFIKEFELEPTQIIEVTI